MSTPGPDKSSGNGDDPGTVEGELHTGEDVRDAPPRKPDKRKDDKN